MANVEIDGVNSKVYTDQVDPKTGTTLTLGTSGDTVSIPSGVTIANSGTATGFGAALTGSTNNTIPTVTGANAISGEANLTFDGTDLTLGTGNVVFGTASKGVYLGVTTATAANLLDDYEFGTFTPTFDPTIGSFTTKGGVAGYYTKIGKMVYAQIHLNVTTNGTGSGNIEVYDLPFTSASVGLTHVINRGRETQISGNSFDVIMSRNVTTMVILSPSFGNGASYDINAIYRV